MTSRDPALASLQTLTQKVAELQRWYERLKSQEAINYSAGSVFSLPIGAAVLSGATVVTVQTNHRALNFADAAVQFVFWSFKLPPGWGGQAVTVDYLWAPSSTNTGNALLTTGFYRQAAGVTLSAVAAAGGGGVQAANGVADRPQLNSSVLSLATFSDGEALSFRILRNGTDGTDTFTGAVQLLAVSLSIVG